MYLDDRNTENYGFQPIAIVHSLPEALFVWALLLSAVQGFWTTFAGLSPYLPLSALIPIVGVCVCIRRTLRPRQKPFEGSAPAPPPIKPSILAQDEKEHQTAELMV